MKKKIGISYTKTNFLNYWNWFTPGDLKNDTELVELNFERREKDKKQNEGNHDVVVHTSARMGPPNIARQNLPDSLHSATAFDALRL